MRPKKIVIFSLLTLVLSGCQEDANEEDLSVFRRQPGYYDLPDMKPASKLGIKTLNLFDKKEVKPKEETIEEILPQPVVVPVVEEIPLIEEDPFPLVEEPEVYVDDPQYYIEEIAPPKPQYKRKIDVGFASSEDEDTQRQFDPDYRRIDAEKTTSTLRVKRHKVVTQDRYLSGVLENAIHSQLPGRFIIVLDAHVYGAEGRRPVLPKGTRIVCQYEGLGKQGDSRLSGFCQRAFLPDGRSLMMADASIGDQMGRTGMIGAVDSRFFERFGAAILFSAISAATTMGTRLNNKDGPIHEGYRAAGDQFSVNIGRITSKIIDKYINLAPVMTVPSGTKITIIPSADIWLLEAKDANNFSVSNFNH